VDARSLEQRDAGTYHSDMAGALIVQPPLRLSRDFIDTPYFAGLGAYQAAAVLRDARVMDGLIGDLVDDGAMAWLGEAPEAFLDRLRAAPEDRVIVLLSPYLLARVGRSWLEQIVDVLAGRRLALVEMYLGGMHYLEYDASALVESLPGAPLLLRYEGEPLLARLDRESWPRRGIWENREPFPLDDLPPPAFEELDAERYFTYLRRALAAPWRPGPIPPDPARTLPIVTARGCPYGCSFCTRNPGLPGERRQVRAVPMPRIADWVRSWRERFALERLVVLDEAPNLDPARFDALLDLLDELDLRVEFPNGLRADRLAETQVARLAARTSRLKVSLESASRRVQDEVLDKRLDPAAVEQVARWAKAHGLPLDVHVLLGIPGERRSEIAATVQMARRLRDEHGARPLVQFATPLPGSRLALSHPPPDDPYPAFQQRSVIHTPEFDPDLLTAARSIITAPRPDPKVIVNLTYQCNNACAFCAVGDRPKRHADVAEVRSALGDYRAQGYDLVDLDGGEPTLHPDLLAVIAHAKLLGYARVTLITNGRRLSYADYAQAIAQSGVDEVLASLHGPSPAIHDALTRVPGSHAQTVEGIRNLLARFDAVAVNTTVVKENVAALPALAELLVELGVRRWNLQVVTPFGRATVDKVPDPTEVARAVTAVRGRLAVQVINCPPCHLPGCESLAVVDFEKSARDMVFVGQRGENLQAFLGQRRRRIERCAECLYQVSCAGEYAF
jgi:MoaA/NifB/PqqE/SkfB family radical SAM enzyme